MFLFPLLIAPEPCLMTNLDSGSYLSLTGKL